MKSKNGADHQPREAVEVAAEAVVPHAAAEAVVAVVAAAAGEEAVAEGEVEHAGSHRNRLAA